MDYKPKKGDIFLWKNDKGTNGHTGVVIGYDSKNDIVTTIESINFKEYPIGYNKGVNLQGTVEVKWKRNSKHLLFHPTTTDRYTASTNRFYTPKIHFTKEKKQ